MERQGQTLGGDGASLSACLLFRVFGADGDAPWPPTIERLRREREDLVAFAAYHGDDRMAQTIDALLAGASYPELVEIVDPGSVRARAARLPRDAPVAWDRVANVPVVPCEPALAHLRAERLGLDWSDPVQRAIAERAADEADILALLRHGP